MGVGGRVSKGDCLSHSLLSVKTVLKFTSLKQIAGPHLQCLCSVGAGGPENVHF